MNRKRSYCGPPGLLPNNLVGKPNSGGYFPQRDDKRVYYTHKGRCGLGLLCKHWQLKAGDEILVPAYNCGSEIDPFLKYDLYVKFYRVDRKANIDVSDIKQRITNRTKVIYVTHYFGWPQTLRGLSEICSENNIYLVEDCALSLFSSPSDDPIGFLGDAAIYSLPKTLPVPDGGVLTASCGIEQSGQAAGYKALLRKMLPLIKRTVLRLFEMTGMYRFLPQWIIRSRNAGKNEMAVTPSGLPEMPGSYYYDKGIEKLIPSRISRYVLDHSNAEALVSRRRDNYTELYDAVKESGVFKPLYDELPEGVCPLCLPVIIEDRQEAGARLNEMGVSAVQWWSGFHKAFDWTEFVEAKYLKEHLLVIPVHQQLTKRNIEYISSLLKEEAVTGNSV